MNLSPKIPTCAQPLKMALHKNPAMKSVAYTLNTSFCFKGRCFSPSIEKQGGQWGLEDNQLPFSGYMAQFCHFREEFFCLKLKIRSCRGEYISKNSYFCTTPENGTAQIWLLVAWLLDNISAQIQKKQFLCMIKRFFSAPFKRKLAKPAL